MAEVLPVQRWFSLPRYLPPLRTFTMLNICSAATSHKLLTFKNRYTFVLFYIFPVIFKQCSGSVNISYQFVSADQ
jgi:hypothetical protein